MATIQSAKLAIWRSWVQIPLHPIFFDHFSYNHISLWSELLLKGCITSSWSHILSYMHDFHLMPRFYILWQLEQWKFMAVLGWSSILAWVCHGNSVEHEASHREVSGSEVSNPLGTLFSLKPQKLYDAKGNLMGVKAYLNNRPTTDTLKFARYGKIYT